MNFLHVFLLCFLLISAVFSLEYTEYVNDDCFYKNDFVFDRMRSRPMTGDEMASVHLYLEEMKLYQIEILTLITEFGIGKPRLPCFCSSC
ncbi:hypothetical protein PFISCL1PPCAC_2229 [Pristionchus fissidentatus]|uniref:Uncharacterized protein n=1 Tax=Pristionchus fissidentatus TaxID=1538716 RepID=A0AAV5UXC9_9BILA|nr:hypothetical protein PFISCL1PPCAC_2229 [Pristionchus fissidentatus]